MTQRKPLSFFFLKGKWFLDGLHRLKPKREPARPPPIHPSTHPAEPAELARAWTPITVISAKLGLGPKHQAPLRLRVFERDQILLEQVVLEHPGLTGSAFQGAQNESHFSRAGSSEVR